jgi:hypothetical protein
MTYFERIVNIETGEEFMREYTKEEIAEVELAQAKAAERAIKEAEIANNKTAILAKLGITEEEAKLLLG